MTLALRVVYIHIHEASRPDKEATGYSGITTRRRSAMFRQSKLRQAGLILFATTLLLILPNLTRLFG
jgi:hypothetical protein